MDAPSSDPAISIRDLHVRRGDHKVLPGISLDVPAGAVTGLLGPSGSGKTTLMRSIVGVQVVEGGELLVLGKPAGTPELRRRVAYVTQSPSIYGDLTIAENLRYFAAILDAPSDRVDMAVETVGLGPQTDQVASTLSGGERSRTSLAVALLTDPEVLVLDEPTVGLDPVLRQDLWATFGDLASQGATLLVSTHVMDEAERCDHLVLMRQGAILALDRPTDLLARTGQVDVESAFIALIGQTS